MRGLKVLFMGGLLALTLVGCGQGEQTQEGRQEPTGVGTEADQPAREPTVAQGGQTTQEATGGGEVAVGGFSVGAPGVPETTVPQVSVEREVAHEYLNQVRPIVEDTARDVSNLVQPEVRLENGQLELDVGLDSLREAREDVRGGLERLREIQPPEGLEPIHERLISAYEEVLPAYDNIIEAAESGDPNRLRDAVGESLPRIERFNDEVRGIVQDLEQAAGTV
ncbi:MAG: hypothetical protein M3N00_05220 [Actinomycetota bacterium]|nr:hypothetical protein [Actinomycetota bacterium]